MKHYFHLIIILLSYIIHCHTYEDMLEYETIAPRFNLNDDCIRESLATDEEVEALQNYQTPNTKNGKCLLACMYKKVNIITPEGRYNPDASIAIAAKSVALQPREMIRVTKVIQYCHEQVEMLSDDETGCEVASAVFRCITENQDSFHSNEDDDEP